MNKKLAIIFDVDGTLVDVSESYKQTDLITPYIYAQKALGIRDLPTVDNWFTVDFIDDLKEKAGFNNDYTCTTTLLDFFLEILNLKVDNYDVISMKNVSFETLHIKRMSEVKTRWYKYLKEKFSVDEKRPEKILDESKWRNLIQNKGSFRDINYIERIFQEIYYGATKFVEYYGIEPKFYQSDEGYYKKEKLLIPVELLKQLQSKNISLGIATGRPQEDLDLFIERFSLRDFFRKNLIITLTDVQKEEGRLESKEILSKPHPWSILELKRRLGNGYKIIMIGDSKDDLVCASKGGVLPVLFSNSENNLELNISYGRLDNWYDLLELIKDF